MKVRSSIAAPAILAAAATITIGAVSAASGGAAAQQTIQVRELFTNATENIDVGKKGPSQGDFMAWNDPLKNLKTGKVVGHIDGTCFLVDVKQQLYNCPGVETVFANGSIWTEGLLSLKGAPVPPDAITSGTGAYAGAHITLTGKPVGTTAEDWTYTIKP
jgi:hypothetical protein